MKRIITLSVVVMALIFTIVGVVKKQSSNPTLDLSDGMAVIANNHQMAKSAMVNNKIVFSANDFERSMNLSNISYITVSSVPPLTDGCLCVGDVAVNAGQTISRENLDLLNFTTSPSSPDSVTTSTFP